MEKEYVYEFLYNPDVYESCPSTVSIHKTRRGAEMAMEFHRAEVKREWEEVCEEYPSWGDYPFDYNKWWGIVETELLP